MREAMLAIFLCSSSDLIVFFFYQQQQKLTTAQARVRTKNTK